MRCKTDALPRRRPLPTVALPVSVTHPLPPETLDCHAPDEAVCAWPDEAACAAWAAALAAQPGITDCVIELHGPLGAGKTTFVRHLLRALGITGRIKSPTYAVMEPYTLPASHGGTEAAHFDFYRFGDPREWVDAGFRDVFARPGLKIAEWPEKAGGLLPVPDLRLAIEPLDESARRVSVRAATATGRAMLAGLRGATPGAGA